MEKILITGQSGFMGFHLVKNLLNDYQVIGLSTKKLESSEIKKSNFTQINQDIRKITPSNFKKKISSLIHLAALTDVSYCQENPNECFDVNVQGTQRALELARHRDSNFIFLSTSHIFGNPKKLPVNENHPKNPVSMYAASKLAGEVLCEAYAKSYGMDIAIIRLFSIYGPKSPNHLVTSKIISQLLTKKTLDLGNLSPKRDFLYIDDAVRAIRLVLKKNRAFNSYNVGYSESHAISELCSILVKFASKNIKIKTKKKLIRLNEIDNIVSDSNKIRKLGWKPTIELKDGLKLTYEWFKSQQ